MRDSVKGAISFNMPTIYRGATHENVRLVFSEGKVVGIVTARETLRWVMSNYFE